MDLSAAFATGGRTVKSLEKWFRRWIGGGYPISAEALGWFRICFALYLLVFTQPGFRTIAGFPPGDFAPPPGLASLFSGFPSLPFLMILDGMVELSAICLLVGIQTRESSILYSLASFVGFSLLFSTGKIDHGQLGTTFLPLIMAFSGWGACFSWDARRRLACGLPPQPTSAAPLAMLALVLGFAYFSAGISKLPVWLDFDITTNGARSWVFKSYYVHGRDDFLIGWFVNLENRWIWEAMDICAVIFECGFLLAAFKPAWFRFWLLAAVGFHVLNLLMLNISFESMFVVYLAFIDWKPWISYVERRGWSRKIDWIGHPLTFIGVVLLLFPLWLQQASPIGFLLGRLPGKSEYAAPILVMSLGVAVSLWQARRAFAQWRSRKASTP